MDNLHQIAELFAASLKRPFCKTCQLSRVDQGEVCEHCTTQKQRKAESLRAFLASRSVDRVKSIDEPSYAADVQAFTGRLF